MQAVHWIELSCFVEYLGFAIPRNYTFILKISHQTYFMHTHGAEFEDVLQYFYILAMPPLRTHPFRRSINLYYHIMLFCWQMRLVVVYEYLHHN